MNLYLYNQKRNRDLAEYKSKLKINEEEFNKINMDNKKILIIGGGYSLTQSQFLNETYMNITNVDLNPPCDSNNTRITNIEGDFLEINMQNNMFDEIWSLYCLPLYAANKAAIKLFFYKSYLTLKAQGVIRFFPLEYDKSEIMSTKDADYDMTTMECTGAVLKMLQEMSAYEVKCTSEEWGTVNDCRKEFSVKMELFISDVAKNDYNSEIIEKIRGICDYEGVKYFIK